MNEAFQCCSCYLIAPLNEHGKCSRCNSDAVISQELFRPAKRDCKTCLALK